MTVSPIRVGLARGLVNEPCAIQMSPQHHPVQSCSEFIEDENIHLQRLDASGNGVQSIAAACIYIPSCYP